MTHASDEDLLAFHWEGGRRSSAHLAGCPECSRRLEELRAVLRAAETAPIPERPDGYGREVWSRVAPRLSDWPARAFSGERVFSGARVFSGWRAAPRLRFVAGAAAAAAIAVAAFLAGRAVTLRSSSAPPSAAALKAASDRILFVDLGRHLDRSEAVLLELVRGPGNGAGTQDVSTEKALLEDLLPANRLYRQTARRAGDAALSSLLDDLERVLLDVRHGPAQLSAAERETLRRRIESEGVLFRLRILSSRVRDQERANSPSTSSDFSIERKRA